MKRKLSLILVALLAVSAIGCGETEIESDETTISTDSSVAEETEAKSGVPDDLDLGEETITIWYTTKSASISESLIDLNPELTGEVLDDAIFNMNKAVETKLNCTLDFYNSNVGSSSTGSEIQKLVLAGDDTFDLYHIVQWNAAKLATEGYYYNMADAEYISYDQPWWDYTYMKEMTIGEDKIYCLSGDFAVDRVRCLNCFYYNKSMYEDFYKDGDGLYTDVVDGNWTWDMLKKICSEVYSDINNNGTADRGDRFGLCTNDYSNLDCIYYGTGVRATERDKDDIPQIVLNNEYAASVLQDLYKIFFEAEGVYNSKDVTDETFTNCQEFQNGNVMFLPGFLYTAESMREMKSDYGIIPAPKYSTEQEDYVSGAHDIIRLMAVPANCQKVDAVSAVLEEMAFQGYNDVLPAYYNVVLKGKYARDDISAEMLDIIRDNCAPDFAYMMNIDIGMLHRRMIQKDTSDFASTYAKYISASEKDLENYIELYGN